MKCRAAETSCLKTRNMFVCYGTRQMSHRHDYNSFIFVCLTILRCIHSGECCRNAVFRVRKMYSIHPPAVRPRCGDVLKRGDWLNFLLLPCQRCLLPPQLVSLLLMGVAAWGKWFGLVSSIRVVAGVIGVGVFLFLVAIVGLCGALKHHQVLLFFVSFWFLRACRITGESTSHLLSAVVCRSGMKSK